MRLEKERSARQGKTKNKKYQTVIKKKKQSSLNFGKITTRSPHGLLGVTKITKMTSKLKFEKLLKRGVVPIIT